jgi:hypothetical protein
MVDQAMEGGQETSGVRHEMKKEKSEMRHDGALRDRPAR